MFPNPVVFETVVFGHEFMLHLFGLLSALASVCIYPIYIGSMMKDGERPPRSTWFLWLVLDVVAATSRWQAGIFDAQLMVYTAGTIVTFTFTIWYGRGGWDKYDTYSVVSVALALAAWGIIGPSVSTACALGGMTVATWPLIRAVSNGEYASSLPWKIALVGSLFNILDEQYLTGIWFTILQVVILFPIVRHWGWAASPPLQEGKV